MKTEALKWSLEDEWQQPPKLSIPRLVTHSSTWHTADTAGDPCENVVYVGWEFSKTGRTQSLVWIWVDCSMFVR